MHKNPPLVGPPIKKAEDMLSTIFLEYYNDKMELQVGDIYQSYGAGLSMHTFEERNIDYNNSPRGMSVLYYFRDNIDLFASESTASVYNNVFLTNDEGSLQADKVYYDFDAEHYRISMFSDKKVKIKFIQ